MNSKKEKARERKELIRMLDRLGGSLPDLVDCLASALIYTGDEYEYVAVKTLQAQLAAREFIEEVSKLRRNAQI